LGVEAVVAPWEDQGRALHEDQPFELGDLREVGPRPVAELDLLQPVDHCWAWMPTTKQLQSEDPMLSLEGLLLSKVVVVVQAMVHQVGLRDWI